MGQFGVNVDADFEPCMLFPRIKRKLLPNSKKEEGANELVLATDEDREGESISWHLAAAETKSSHQADGVSRNHPRRHP